MLKKILSFHQKIAISANVEIAAKTDQFILQQKEKKKTTKIAD